MRELGDLSCHLHAGRTSSDHHERHQARALSGVRLAFGKLERAEDARTDLERIIDRLQAGCSSGELVVAEVGLSRPVATIRLS